MKASIIARVASLLLAAHCLADSYTVHVYPGYNMIACQLDNPRFFDVVEGTTIYRWNCGDWIISNFSFGIWDTIPVPSPGEGFLLYSTTEFTLTVSGFAHVPVLPLCFPCAYSQAQLVGCQTNAPATFEDIVGWSPAEGTILERHGLAGDRPYSSSLPYEQYRYTNGAWYWQTNGTWQLKTPLVDVGEAVYITDPGQQVLHPPITVEAVQPVATEAGQVPAEVVFRLAHPWCRALIVPLDITGTAVNGVDYQYVPCSVQFGPGQTEATVLITPLPDDICEPDETVVLTVADQPTATATVTIRNDPHDCLPQVSIVAIDPVDDIFGHRGCFRISRSVADNSELEVYFTTQSGFGDNGFGKYYTLSNCVPVDNIDMFYRKAIIPAGQYHTYITVIRTLLGAPPPYLDAQIQLKGQSFYRAGSPTSASVRISFDFSNPPWWAPPPGAIAAGPQYVSWGSQATLDGSLSYDQWETAFHSSQLEYLWTVSAATTNEVTVNGQCGSVSDTPRIVLDDATTSVASFRAPDNWVGSLACVLTVKDSNGNSAQATNLVTVLEDITQAVFVSAGPSGNDTKSGTRLAPVKSLDRAIELARSFCGNRDIYVADDTTTNGIMARAQTVTLEDHMSIYGRFMIDAYGNWTRTSPRLTRLLGAETALAVMNVTNQTTIDGFSIEAADGHSGTTTNAVGDIVGRDRGGNSIAIYLKNVNTNLVIRNNQILAGRGGNGADGAAGQTLAGNSGAKGTDGCWWYPTLEKIGYNNGNAGGSGGATRAGDPSEANGGAGASAGAGFWDTNTSFLQFYYGAAPAGAGGGGALGGENGATIGASGMPGSTGGIGVPAQFRGYGGLLSGNIAESSWVGNNGSAGEQGTAGSGGGGGGCGFWGWGAVSNADFVFFLVEVEVSPILMDFMDSFCAEGGPLCPGIGGGGGGGGAGGSGGGGGGAGYAGGASFGVFVTESHLDSLGPRLWMNTIQTAGGGSGGNGGNGRDGGQGGAGGCGGQKFDSVDYQGSGAGGCGGYGGSGGPGSGGGGGAGGRSCGIHVVGGFPPPFRFNTFSIGPGGSGGAGGSGGTFASRRLMTGCDAQGNAVFSEAPQDGRAPDGTAGADEVSLDTYPIIKLLDCRTVYDTGEYSVSIPPCCQLRVTGQYQHTPFALSLQSPTPGKVYDANTEAPDFANMASGDIFGYAITNADSGTWTLKTTALDPSALGKALVLEVTILPLDTPPVAEAGPDIVWEATGPTGASVRLNAFDSSDADFDVLTFTWTLLPQNTTIAQGSQANVTLPLGTNEVAVTVDDGRGQAAVDQTAVIVRDTTPPVIYLRGSNPYRLGIPRDSYNDPGCDVSDAVDPSPTVIVTSTVDTNIVGTYITTYVAMDASGNTSVAYRTVVVSLAQPELNSGVLLRSVFYNIDGGTLEDLRNCPRFPSSPDCVVSLADFEAPSDWGDQYGQVIEGILTPPLSGKYMFYLSSSDYAELRLTDATGTNDEVIIVAAPSSAARDWAGAMHIACDLEAGKHYVMQVVMMARVGSDYLGLTWKMPGQGDPTNGAPPIPGQYFRAIAGPPGACVCIGQQPLDAICLEGGTGTFELQASSCASLLHYQWYSNYVGLSGATSSNYVTLPVTLGDDNTTYMCNVSSDGMSLWSRAATLKVQGRVGFIALAIDCVDCNTEARVSAKAATNQTYVVEVSQDLTRGEWSPIYTNMGPFAFTVSTRDGAARRFYRAHGVPPP